MYRRLSLQALGTTVYTSRLFSVKIEIMELEDEYLDTLEPSAKRSRPVGDDGRCSKQASKQRYSKKRKFAGNQYTKTTKKQRKVKRVYLQKKNSTLEGYRLVDMEIFHNIISSLVCPECYGALQAEEDSSKKKGLASFIIIS